MENNVKRKTILVSAAFLYLFMLMTGPLFASITIYDGSDFYETLNGGAFINESPLAPSDFAYRDIVSHPPGTDGTVSGTRPLYEIPVFDIASTLYFGFIFDAQEVEQISGAADPEISIDGIAVSVDSIPIWNWDDSLILNPNVGLVDYTPPTTVRVVIWSSIFQFPSSMGMA